MSLLPILIAAMTSALIAGTGLIQFRSLRRRAEQARTGQCCHSFAEAAGVLVLRCDWSGTVTSASPNCESLLGVPPSEVMGRGFFERVQVADRPAFLKTVSDARLGSAPADTALRWRGAARAGRHDYAEPVFHWLEMRVRRAVELQPVGVETRSDDAILILRDVTLSKLREAEIGTARAAAEEAKLDKDHFLAHAGHELRAPLNAIVGFSELLAEPRLAPRDSEKQREYARIIHQSGLHLLSVVNAILNVSKIESGALGVELERFAVAPLIDLCCDMVKLRAKSRGVELLRAYPENLDEITGDKRACTQILINLLSNAINFTPANGRVTISVRPEPQSLVIYVADTGVGIAACDLAHIGDPFFQAKSSPDRQDHGTGLGLAIVRGLVGLQGGTILVASEPGKGTCVHVRLPLDCRSFAGKAGALAKIETVPGLPVHEQHDLYKQMTVQKIA